MDDVIYHIFKPEPDIVATLMLFYYLLINEHTVGPKNCGMLLLHPSMYVKTYIKGVIKK